MVDLDRVSDLELLRTVAKIQDAEIRRLQDKLVTLTRDLAASSGKSTAEIEAQLRLLQEELNEAYRRTYQQGSERRPREDKPAKEKKPQKGHGPKEQPQLPVVEVVHDVDPADQICPSCGGELVEWPGQFEESEEIDVIDVQYVLKKHLRKKRRCGCGNCIETAIGPTKLIPGGRYSLDFAIHVAMEKYGWHLPLERQVKRMKESGLFADSQTLWDQIWSLSRCFVGVHEALQKYLLSKEVLLADESHWPLLGAKGHPTKNWFTWSLVAEDAVLYKILDSRSNEAASEVLIDFRGVLLTDGYIVYESQSKKLGFVQAHDWSHARRKFIEAEASAPDQATEFIDDIGKLFMVEREIAEQVKDLSPEAAAALRAKMRATESKPIAQRIGRNAAEVKALRESPMAKAVRYLENMWDGLIRFLDDPRVPITSNAVERALRCVVLGRNNHFGSRSSRGIDVASIFYSVIESAKLCGLEPRAYLRMGALAHLRGETVPMPHQIKASAS